MARRDDISKHADALGIALNEASLLGAELDAARRVATLTFRVLTLPDEGPAPADATVQLILSPVGRVAASLRKGAHDDKRAAVEPFSPKQLDEVVRSFGGQPIYGWEFFDTHKYNFREWSNRLSLDFRRGSSGMNHSLSLWQEGLERHLDLIVWFDAMSIRDASGRAIELETFCADGARWWQAMYEGDRRTKGFGIAPLADAESAFDLPTVVESSNPAGPGAPRTAKLRTLLLATGLLLAFLAWWSRHEGMPMLLWGTGVMLGMLLLWGSFVVRR